MMFAPNGRTKQIWGREFSVVKNGLDPAEVSAFVIELIEQTAGLTVREGLWPVSGTLPGQVADEGEYRDVGPAEGRAREILDAARERADSIIADAQHEAARIAAAAREEAESSERQGQELVRAALRKAEQVKSPTVEQANGILAEAKLKAEAAERQAREILGEAEAQVEAIRAVAEEEARRIIVEVRKRAEAEAHALRHRVDTGPGGDGDAAEIAPKPAATGVCEGFLSPDGRHVVPEWSMEDDEGESELPQPMAAVAVEERECEEPADSVAAPDPEGRRNNSSGALYEGTVELAIVPPISVDGMLKLHKRLRRIPKVRVLNTNGSADKGMRIRLQLHDSMPLLDILRRLPEVLAASEDRLRTGGNLYFARRNANEPAVRKILVAPNHQKCVVY